MSAADVRMLVLAKAPVAGEAKTRLGAEIGMQAAADVAAAALEDTLAACEAAVGAERCVLALAGEMEAPAGWTVVPQRGDGFAERLVNAHADAGPGPVVQVGMDTPQATPDQLLAVAARLEEGYDVVVGRAEDGGWWVLARHDPAAAEPLGAVEMSTPSTYDDTCAALAAARWRVGTTVPLRDVDTVADAAAVAALAPDTRFARTWKAVGP